ncbi:MAG TPA: PEP-CTERM sorting domain-containing protein [Rhizomicrobium sp.]|nr:PEP-CTERM sorting domain-containing protein [Rhizomicrobium sp.]
MQTGNRRLLIGTFAAALLAFGTSPAAADIILDTSLQASGQGFGAVQRLLTVEQTGSDKTNPTGTEMACDANVGGAISTNSCLGTDASAPNNGYFTPNSADAVNGPVKNSLGDLSTFTDANQIVIVYNPSQTKKNPGTNIQDITLKFYDSNNNLVIAVDGGCGDSCTGTSADPLFFGDTGVNLGNGGTGFALILDANQAALVDAACGAQLLGCSTLAVETTILGANDGPDSYSLANINDLCTPGVDCPTPQNVPEPITLSLFGAGLAGAVGLFRRRKKSA